MTDYDELKKAAEAAIGSPAGYVERGANYTYEKLVTPEAILALLSERAKLLKVVEAAYTQTPPNQMLQAALMELDATLPASSSPAVDPSS